MADSAHVRWNLRHHWQKVESDDLVPGEFYRIEFEDCCVAGNLIDKFLYHLDDEEGLKFVCGIFTTYHGVSFYHEVEVEGA